MTKPIDETWSIEEEMVAAGDFSATDEAGFCVVTAYGVTNGETDDGLAMARLRLAAMAPDGFRALKRLFDAFPEPKTTEEAAALGEASAALKKAGVL